MMQSYNSKTLLITLVLLLLLELLLPDAAVTQTIGGVQWKSIDPAGVSILALVPHPTDPLTLYAVVDAHGVYKSIDGGETWQAKNQGIEGLTVFNLIVANEAGKVLYVATLGDGVFKSTNGGETWEPSGNMESGIVEVEPLDPRWGVLGLAAMNESTVYAGTGGAGIYSSQDGGNSWHPVNEGLRQPAGLDVDVNAILLDPEHQDTIFIGTKWGIFKSKDNAMNWQQVFPSETSTLAFADGGKTIYAGSTQGLIRSEDEGNHWDVVRQAGQRNLLEIRTLLVDGDSLYVGTDGGLYEFSNSQQWEDSNGNLLPSALTVRGIVKIGKSLYVGTGQGIFRSDNNGTTWTQLSDGLPEKGLLVKGIVCSFDKENNLYIGTWGGGIYKSLDRGATWSEINEGLESPYVRRLTANNGILYAATANALYVIENEAESWYLLASSAHNAKFVHAFLDDQVYALVRLWEKDSDNQWKSMGRLFKSNDGGNSWAVVETFVMFDITDILVSPENSQIIYVATRKNGAYQSIDGGNQWIELNQEMVIQDIHTLALGGKAGDILFAGTPIGLYRRDSDSTWERTILGSYDTIVTDLSHPNRVYAANTQGALIFSEDYGRTWKSMGFIDGAINDIAFDPNGNMIYVATEGQGMLQGSVEGLFSENMSWAVIRGALFGLVMILIIGFLVVLSLRHYPTYAGQWSAAADYPLQQIIPLVTAARASVTPKTLDSTLRTIQAFSTAEQVQDALDGLVARGLMRPVDDTYRFVAPWTACVHRWLQRQRVVSLAERVRTQHPLYTRTQSFFAQARYDLRELGADAFLLIPYGQAHPQASYGPIYTRLIAGRAPTGDDFTAVCEAARAHVGDDLAHRVVLVISDRRPQPGARYRLYEIRQQEGLAIVPLDVSLFDQMKPNRTAQDILASEIDQATGQQNLYAISGPVSGDLSFFGRERVLQDIIDLLDIGQPVGLFGLRKMGKTSLIQRLQGRLLHWRPIVLMDTQKTAQQQGVWSLYPDIIAAFVSYLLQYRPDVARPKLHLWPEPGISSPAMADAFTQDIKAFCAKLGTPNKDARLLLIIDEIDRLLPAGVSPGYEGFATFFGQLRALNQQEQMLNFLVVGVDATLNRTDRWRDRDNELYRALHEVWMPPMAFADVREMIESLGFQMGVRYEEDALDRLAECSGGQPFVTRQMCSRAVAERLGQGAITITLKQAQTAIEEFLFDDPYLPELWRTRLDETQRVMLRTLARSEEPLSHLALLPGVQRQAAVASLVALENYTLIRQEGGHYTIVWDAFRQWIRWFELGLEA